ncbi:MAG: (cytosine-5)-methyltransferase 1 [Acidimicrobiaceae bacterium]|nr:(cytosine-5)-methyltransferase 1 [Acidimicrobiaceae bacterium]
MTTRRAPRFIDLFAGCGGITRGLLDAGFRLVGAVENDRAAAATFAANFGERHVTFGPVERYVEVPEADVVVGGPPCQGFSGLGKRDSGDPRNRLWRDYARVVRATGCMVFVLENVDRFLKSEQMSALVRATRRGGILEGYEIEGHLLNAADYGTAQRRVRAVVIGSRVGPIGAPRPTRGREGAPGSPTWLTLADVIQGLDPEPHLLLPEISSPAWGASVDGPFKLGQIHVARTYSDTSLARFKAIPPGGNRFDLPDELKAECWRRHTSGACDVMGRLRWDRPSVTIRTEFFKPEKGRYLHPDAHRAITHAEAALVQGFDDRHQWCGSKTQIARQIGNAVPPPLATAIGRQIRRVLARGRSFGGR